MKVAQWHFSFFPRMGGGIETHIDTLVRGMRDTDFEILTNRLVRTKRREDYLVNAKIVRFGPVDYFHSGVFPLKKRATLVEEALMEIIRTGSIRKYIAGNDFDLLHIHGISPNLPYLATHTNCSVLKKLSKSIFDVTGMDVPMVHTRHAITTDRFYPEMKAWEDSYLNMFDNVICVDRMIYDYVRQLPGDKQGKRNVWHIPNFVDTDLFGYKDQTFKGRLKVGYAGRFEPEKGAEILLQVLGAAPEDIEFHIAGSESPSKELDRDNIHFYPSIPSRDMPSFYQKVNVVLYPAVDAYGAGRVTLEAMSCGRPVMMFPGDRYPIIDGRTGFIVGQDARLVLQKLAEISGDRDMLARMGVEGRAIIEREFSVPATLPRVREVYTSILKNR